MTLVFENCRLIDGISDAPQEGVDVVIEGASIKAVNRHGTIPHEKDFTVVRSHDLTLLPGLIDCHVHYTIDSSLDVYGIEQSVAMPDTRVVLVGARQSWMALKSGITTARSAGASRALDIPLRDAIAAGDIPGPRLLAAGTGLTVTGGYGREVGVEADGIPELIKTVRSIVKGGADVVKVFSSGPAQLTSITAGLAEARRLDVPSMFTVDEIAAVVREAQRMERRVLSHAQTSSAVVASARGGVSSVEHAFLADREALEVVKDCGTTLCPNLVVTDVWKDVRGATEAQLERQRLISVHHRKSCETAIELGINIVAGTDTGVRGVLPNMLWCEVVLLHDHGLSPMDAIKAATSRAAALLGVDEEVGAVEPGKQADVIAVHGNPLKNLRLLQQPEYVIQRGAIAYPVSPSRYQDAS